MQGTQRNSTPAKVLLSFYFCCCFFSFSQLFLTKQNTKQKKRTLLCKKSQWLCLLLRLKNNRSSLFTGVTPSFESHMRPYYLYTISSITHLLYKANDTQLKRVCESTCLWADTRSPQSSIKCEELNSLKRFEKTYTLTYNVSLMIPNWLANEIRKQNQPWLARTFFLPFALATRRDWFIWKRDALIGQFHVGLTAAKLRF